MNILVTGACGFIGSHLVEKLVKENVAPLNEKTIKITITNPPYDARVKSFFRELILARHIL